VTKGDLFQLDLEIDLLVISAYEGFYGGLPGSLIGQLRDQCGIEVGQFEMPAGSQELRSNSGLDQRRACFNGAAAKVADGFTNTL
jgi:hypothetical protein